jgi:hypothetical protein
MLIMYEFPISNKNRGRVIFHITSSLINELNYEMSSMYTKSVFYVEDLLTGELRGLYTADLYELMTTQEQYIQLDKHHFYIL